MRELLLGGDSGANLRDFDIHVHFQVNDHSASLIKGPPSGTKQQTRVRTQTHTHAAAKMHISPLCLCTSSIGEHCLILIVILISFTRH